MGIEPNPERDARVTELTRMTKTRIIDYYRTGVKKPNGGRVRAISAAYPLEKWTKDELISAIIGIEYPQPQESPLSQGS